MNALAKKYAPSMHPLVLIYPQTPKYKNPSQAYRKHHALEEHAGL